MLLQTIYASARRADESGADLQDILWASRRNNPAIDVTGLLVILPDRYVQALEGPAGSVEPLLDFISDDARHAGMRIVTRLQAGERSFARFAMADFAPSSDPAARLTARVDNLIDRPDPAAGRDLWRDLARLSVEA